MSELLEITIKTSKLRELREKARLSRSEVAEKTGITSQNISMFEAGKSYPSVNLLAKLLILYKAEIRDVL